MKIHPAVEAYGLRTIFALGLTALLAASASVPPTLTQVGGLFVLVFLSGWIVHIQLKREHILPQHRRPAERLVWITALLGVGGVYIVKRAVGAGTDSDAALLAAAPLVAQGLLIGGLVGCSLASTTVSMAVLLLGAAGAVAWPVLLAAWGLGVGGSFLISPLKKRSDLLRAVFALFWMGGLVGAAVALSSTNDWAQIGESTLWGAVACLIASSIFWLGATLMEKLVGLTSDWTLLELCSPEHPLIQELCTKAPGTYAHSVAVGNLAEAAARAIGANTVVCRAMAAFHDVGKINRPACFIENQRGRNIHDDLNPAYSARIIIGHVAEGVALGEKHRLPQVIIDGIAQHHGTSLLTPFFKKATQGCEVEEDMERLFRYAGPKPQTREAAILHLADTLEAASRTLNSREETADFVHRLVERSRQDGQLEECDLTFRELQAIQDSFISSLDALRHDRISYPELTANEAKSTTSPDSAESVGPETTASAAS